MLPNDIDIFGVNQCGYFEDSFLVSNNISIPQYCYKYDDWQSCYCIPSTARNNDDVAFCKQFVCHQYENNAKNNMDIDADYEDPDYQKYRQNLSNFSYDPNVSSDPNLDILSLSTKISDEEYQCIEHYSNDIDPISDPVDKSECTLWRGNLTYHDKIGSMECNVEAWNSDTSTFTDFDPKTQGVNISYDDLVASYSYKWVCKESIPGNDELQLSEYIGLIIGLFVGLLILLCFIVVCVKYKKKKIHQFQISTLKLDESKTDNVVHEEKDEDGMAESDTTYIAM